MFPYFYFVIIWKERSGHHYSYIKRKLHVIIFLLQLDIVLRGATRFTMNIYSRCTRKFNHKNSLHRHLEKRRFPCTPPVTDCEECGKSFSSVHSLKKHEKLYCKNRRLPPLADYLAQNEKGIFRDLPPQRTSPQSLNFNSNTSKDGLLHTPVYTAFSSKLDDVAEQTNPVFH